MNKQVNEHLRLFISFIEPVFIIMPCVYALQIIFSPLLRPSLVQGTGFEALLELGMLIHLVYFVNVKHPS